MVDAQGLGAIIRVIRYGNAVVPDLIGIDQGVVHLGTEEQCLVDNKDEDGSIVVSISGCHCCNRYVLDAIESVMKAFHVADLSGIGELDEVAAGTNCASSRVELIFGANWLVFVRRGGP